MVPDLLGALDRQARVRRKAVVPFVDESDPVVADVAGGILQHLDDDKWFHTLPAFLSLSNTFAREIRELLMDKRTTRAWFLGHILVELFLDAKLIEGETGGTRQYYQAVAQVDPGVLQRVVNRLTSRPTQKLERFHEMFLRERFLDDYGVDMSLFVRLNQIMSRIGLQPIDPRLLRWLPSARLRVYRDVDRLRPDERIAAIPQSRRSDS